MTDFKFSNAIREMEVYGYDSVVKSHCRMCHGSCLKENSMRTIRLRSVDLQKQIRIDKYGMGDRFVDFEATESGPIGKDFALLLVLTDDGPPLVLIRHRQSGDARAIPLTACVAVEFADAELADPGALERVLGSTGTGRTKR